MPTNTISMDVLDTFMNVFYSIKFTPDRILKSGDATIVFWKDGTKTIVKRAADEPDNEYMAFTAALAKKIYGSNSAIKTIIESKTEVQKKKNDKD